MASVSSLPAPALQASKAALSAALAENVKEAENKANGEEAEPGEIQEVDMQAQAETIRTVFSDPTNFNVKVRISMHSAFSLDADQWMAAQHPLYSPWTLWFDSPATKGRNLPQTPMTSFPQTPIPQTPGGIAAQGWMEDIKRVITFDSVEEFWGYVNIVALSATSANRPPNSLYNNIVPPSQLPQKANYYLFKASVLRAYLLSHPAHSLLQEGIIPAWEDEANKNGGKWSIQLPRDKNRGVVDKMWLYTVRFGSAFMCL